VEGAAKSFYIGKYEVTQAQWKTVMGGNNPSYFKGESLPVENVSWNNAQEFIARLNAATGRAYRLPTQAEWEYAFRGGSKSQNYEYSGSNSEDNVAWYCENSDQKTHPVGTKQPNELGIYDMSGNVWEWCEEWSDSSQTTRILRGGSWVGSAVLCRSANRRGAAPGTRSFNVGFRVALFSNE